MRLRVFIVARSVLFASIAGVEAARIGYGRTHAEAWADHFRWWC
jgi:hypothetical protein